MDFLFVAAVGITVLSLGLALRRRKQLKSEMRLLNARWTSSILVVASILGGVYYEEKKEDYWIRKAAAERGLSLNDEDIGVSSSVFDKYYERMEPYKDTLEEAYFDSLTKAVEVSLKKQELADDKKS